MLKAACLFFLLALITVAAGCGDGGQVQSSASGLDAQTREGGGASVTATPQNLGEAEPNWVIQVVFDTHTVELSQDLAQVSVLVADGKEYVPVAWEGDPSGGHHREGILKFLAVSPRPKKVELIIREVGGVERSFSWELD